MTTEKRENELRAGEAPLIRENPIKFLGYVIGDVGNGDGINMYRDGALGTAYDTHLGYYKTVGQAKRAAVLYFMLRRPETFACELVQIVYGRGREGRPLQPFNWYRFKEAVSRAGFNLPADLTPGPSPNVNGTTLGGTYVHFDGEPLLGWE